MYWHSHKFENHVRKKLRETTRFFLIVWIFEGLFDNLKNHKLKEILGKNCLRLKLWLMEPFILNHIIILNCSSLINIRFDSTNKLKIWISMCSCCVAHPTYCFILLISFPLLSNITCRSKIAQLRNLKLLISLFYTRYISWLDTFISPSPLRLGEINANSG